MASVSDSRICEARTPSKLAFLGLGIMGWGMAHNLAEAGFEVSAWTRSREKAERFAAEHNGGEAPATPAAAAQGAGAVVSMVPDAPQVEEVLLGDEGAVGALEPGAVCVDMSTIAPTASRAIGERLAERDLEFLEAPVSGSKPKAEAGTLTIMAAGEEATFERARPLFDAMGELIVHVGPLGHGQLSKLVTNVLGAVNAAALAEGLGVIRAGGVDPDAFITVAKGSAGGSAMLELKAGPMLEGDFEPPLFKLEHMLKDVRHCLEEAEALGMRLRLGELAEGLYAEAERAGHGEEDFAAVATAAR
jgi:3-hydroxyisobutyrate dehydrogenase